jgi:hypothetical protein
MNTEARVKGNPQMSVGFNRFGATVNSASYVDEQARNFLKKDLTREFDECLMSNSPGN